MRAGFGALIVGKYLFIAGGNDGHRHMTDVYALDTETMEWECLNDGSEAGMDVVNLKQRSMYSMFHNNKLYTVKPNREVGMRNRL